MGVMSGAGAAMVYGAEDNATVDKDNKTGAKVIETGVTELMRLEYSPGLCQSY